MGKVKALSLVDNIPLNSALTNDEGWGEVYIQQLERLFTPGDILITISVHGGKGSDKAGQWSQNLMKAISFVQRHKGKAVGITGFDGGAMVEQCDGCIVVPANTTPLVESFHVVLHHLITFSLYEGDRE
jgi:D-sedoheptulose 7-phosphate isomerase